MKKIKNNILIFIAEVISRTFDIYVVMPIVLLICYYIAVGNPIISFIWLCIFLFVEVVIPVCGDIYLVRKGKLVDWDLTNRKQRVKYMYIDVILQLGLFFLVYIFNAPSIFKAMSGILLILEFIYTLITKYWKISIHAQLVTLLSFFVIMFMGESFSYFLISIPLVFFSRIYLSKHTIWQLIAGSIITFVVCLIVFKIFNYY